MATQLRHPCCMQSARNNLVYSRMKEIIKGNRTLYSVHA